MQATRRFNCVTLGTWQQIVLVDFDVRPRRREIVVELAGD